jgi:hypothetical protein
MFQDPHPYVENIGDNFRFLIDYNNLQDISIKIEIYDNKSNNFLEMFKIKELYKYHDNIAKEFVQKKLCYSEELIKNFSEGSNNLYTDINGAVALSRN